MQVSPLGNSTAGLVVCEAPFLFSLSLLVLLSFLLRLLFSLLFFSAGSVFISSASPLFPSAPQAAVLPLSAMFLFPWLHPHAQTWFLVLYQQSYWDFFLYWSCATQQKTTKGPRLKLPMGT